MEPSLQSVELFRVEVLDFYETAGRDLPWRRTRDPYAILVSEIMLQQTPVRRVLPFYQAFLRRFPTVQSLAAAPLAGALRLWNGLGYNLRAARLRDAARIVVTEQGGVFPSTVDGLRRLPGIGAYTSRAVACFAFDAQVAVVETNVRRALAYFASTSGLNTCDFDALADSLLPTGNAWTWNQAMIDFGAVKLARPDSARRNPGPTRRPRRARQLAGLGASPFVGSDRFWRGRIVATLCAYPEPVSVARLLRELPRGGEECRIRALINGLNEEGLIDVPQGSDSVSLAV